MNAYDKSTNVVHDCEPEPEISTFTTVSEPPACTTTPTQYSFDPPFNCNLTFPELGALVGAYVGVEVEGEVVEEGRVVGAEVGLVVGEEVVDDEEEDDDPDL